MSAEAATVRPMIRMSEVARTLSVTRMTIYRWIAKGEFPTPVDLGGNAVAFYEDEVAEWQKKKEAASLRPPVETWRDVRPRDGYRRGRRPR